MKIIVYILLLSIFSLDFLFSKIGAISRYIALIPDYLSLIAATLIILQVSFKKKLMIHPKYTILFSIFFIHVLVGIILNSVQPGVLFAGFRTYFRYLPFFLLPALYNFSDIEIKTQLKFLLGIALFQLPVTLYQRFIQYVGNESGDPITGTLTVSSELSIFLIATTALLFSFFLKKELSFFTFLLILPFLFFPTTLNETKGTIILLPVAIMIPAVLLTVIRRKISTLVPVTLVCGLLIISFTLLYNLSLGTNDTQRSLNNFIFEGEFTKYLYKEAEGKIGEKEYDVGRLDGIILALKTLSSDTTKLFSGFGIGNVTQSFTKDLEGKYYSKYAHMQPAQTSMSMLLWETGLVGLMLFIVWFILIFFDSLHNAKTDSVAGAVSLGWAAVVFIYILSLAYKNYLPWNSLGYSFWYFSGYVAAKRFWLYSHKDSFVYTSNLATKISTKVINS